ncbi:MAG: hypothetical protein LBM60_01275 [Clostridium sp.]|jgi:hypothetical protein|nr:hypothetical protein [Clostridium sp.]
MKYKWLLVVELICILLSIVCCFTPEKKVYEITGEMMGTLSLDNVGNGIHYGKTMTLAPGVYQVRAYANISTGQFLTFEVCQQNGSFHALLGNVVAMPAGQEYLDYEIYVTATVEAYVLTQFSNDTATTALQSLTLYRTAYGSRILFVIVLLISIVLNFMLYFRQKILLGQVSKAGQIAFWVLAASTVLAYFPYFTDYMTFGADTAFHLLRIEGLKETLLTGTQFPVRMQSYWLADHGYPVSMFYGDLFLYFPAFLRIMGFPLMIAYKIFRLVMIAATARIAFYSFKKCTMNTYAALFGSVIYVLSPFGIYLLTNMDAVGQYLGMTFMPLIFCGIYLLYTQDPQSASYRKAKIPLVIGICCVLNAHFLTTEIVLVLLLVFCLLFIKRTFRKRTLLQLVLAAGLSILLTAFFWVPFLIMLAADQYRISGIFSTNIQQYGIYFSSFLQFYPYMGAAQTGMYHAEPLHLGVSIGLMLSIFIIRFMIRRVKKDTYRNPYIKRMLLLFCMTLFIFFTSTHFFPWDLLEKIPGIQYLTTALQFPKRLLAPATVLGSFFAAFFCLWIQKESDNPKMTKGILLFLSIITIASAVFHVNDIAYENTPIRLYSAENFGTISLGNGEYLPRDINWYEVGSLYTYHEPVAEEGLRYTDYEKNGTNISIHVENTQDAKRYLEVALIGYPGYGITGIPDDADQTSSEIPLITPQNGNHEDLRIEIPANWSGTIRIRYKGFLMFRVAEVVSLVTIVGLLIVHFYNRKRKSNGG